MAARRYRYLHLDVFTNRRFGGNQLAVFPDASGLTDRAMQLMAREMNFAESTFLTDSSQTGTDVRLRIFTPAVEMPMAGHPVIGTTFALAQLGRIVPPRQSWVFGLNIGPLPVELEWKSGRLDFAWMTQRSPEFGEPEDVSAVAAALNVTDRLILDTGLPVQRVSCGVPFVMVPMISRAAVDDAVADAQALSALAAKSGLSHYSLYCFTQERSRDDEADTYSRMFAPGLGVYEDPATGSASGPLGCYLVRHGALAAGVDARGILNLQGRKLGRPSWIRISIESQGSTIRRVRVGGMSVLVAEGMFDVDGDAESQEDNER
jgi:trans-2,3-dihydro-3-hydroxyanthranilate isomerase